MFYIWSSYTFVERFGSSCECQVNSAKSSFQVNFVNVFFFNPFFFIVLFEVTAGVSLH